MNAKAQWLGQDTESPLQSRDGGSNPLTLIAVGLLGAAPALGQGKGDRAFGQYLSAECVTCHQVSGRFDGIPSIVGRPDDSFVEIMNEYRAKKRTNPVMQNVAGKLSDEEVAALAAYFGSLPPQRKN